MALTRFHILLSCSALLFAGCGDKTPTRIQFVVPDNFKGVIQLVSDTNHGAALKPSGGTYKVVIPPAGKVRIASFVPFDSSHQVTAIYASGALLPVELGPFGPNGVVALRIPCKYPGNDNSECDYLVGTPEDAKSFYRALSHPPNPQGGVDGEQPSGSETNRTSEAAAPRRSP
jgi:hypothetical protein